MKFGHKITALMILAAMQLPFTTFAAEEDRELAPIAAEQPHRDEEIGEVNPALTDKISTEKAKETDKDLKKRKKKLEQTRKEKEKENERKLKQNEKAKSKDKPREEVVIIDPNEPAPPPQPTQSRPQTVTPPPQPTQSRPQTVTPPPQPQPEQRPSQSSTIDTTNLPNQKLVYANFTEVARAVHFVPLYMPRKSGYEITAMYAAQGIAEIRYGRRWEPTVSLTVRTYKRADGEELRDISGVTGVKWRIDTTTGTTIYIAKISDTQQVAAWAVGHYTFSAQAENLSFAGFHSLVADELVELSTHYYFDL